MKEELTKSEKGLIWSAFVFALIAVLTAMIPWLTAAVDAIRSHDSGFSGGVVAVIMMAFSAFSWSISLIMLIVSTLTNLRTLRSRIGIITCFLDAGVLAYTLILINVMAAG